MRRVDMMIPVFYRDFNDFCIMHQVCYPALLHGTSPHRRLNSADIDSIALVVTLGTPHLHLPKLVPSPVWPFRQPSSHSSPSLIGHVKRSRQNNRCWPAHLHILAGRGDMMVPELSSWRLKQSSQQSLYNNTIQPEHHTTEVHVDLENVPGVWCTTNHKSLVSCNQLVRRLVPILADVAYSAVYPTTLHNCTVVRLEQARSDVVSLKAQGGRDFACHSFQIAEEIRRRMSTRASAAFMLDRPDLLSSSDTTFFDGTATGHGVRFPCFPAADPGFGCLNISHESHAFQALVGMGASREYRHHAKKIACRIVEMIDSGSRIVKFDHSTSEMCYDWRVPPENDALPSLGWLSLFVTGLTPGRDFVLLGKTVSPKDITFEDSLMHGVEDKRGGRCIDIAKEEEDDRARWVDLTGELAPFPLSVMWPPLPRSSREVLNGIHWIENATWVLNIPRRPLFEGLKMSSRRVEETQSAPSRRHSNDEIQFAVVRMLLTSQVVVDNETDRSSNGRSLGKEYLMNTPMTMLSSWHSVAKVGSNALEDAMAMPHVSIRHGHNVVLPHGHAAVLEVRTYDVLSALFSSGIFNAVKPPAARLALPRFLLGKGLPTRLSLTRSRCTSPSDLETDALSFLNPAFVSLDEHDTSITSSDAVRVTSMHGASPVREGLNASMDESRERSVPVVSVQLPLWHPSYAQRRLVLVSDPRCDLEMRLEWDFIPWLSCVVRSHAFALFSIVSGCGMLRLGGVSLWEFRTVPMAGEELYEKEMLLFVVSAFAVFVLVPAGSYAADVFREIGLAEPRLSISAVEVLALVIVGSILTRVIRLFVRMLMYCEIVVFRIARASIKAMTFPSRWFCSFGERRGERSVLASSYDGFWNGSNDDFVVMVVLLAATAVHPGLACCITFVFFSLHALRLERSDGPIVPEDRVSSSLKVANSWIFLHFCACMPCVVWLYSWLVSDREYSSPLWSQESMMALGIALHAAFLTFRMRGGFSIEQPDDRLCILACVFSMVCGLWGHTEVTFALIAFLCCMDALITMLQMLT